MSEPVVKQIVLASRPQGLPTRENFRLQEAPMPELPQGGLLLRVLYLSLDPYMRGRMDDRKSYAKPVGLGEVDPRRSCKAGSPTRVLLQRDRCRASQGVGKASRFSFKWDRPPPCSLRPSLRMKV